MGKHLKRELRTIAPAELRRVRGGGTLTATPSAPTESGHEEHIELISISFGSTTPRR